MWLYSSNECENECINIYMVHSCVQMKTKFCCYLLSMGKLLGSLNATCMGV
jgi:hypothetical protein